MPFFKPVQSPENGLHRLCLGVLSASAKDFNPIRRASVSRAASQAAQAADSGSDTFSRRQSSRLVLGNGVQKV